MSQDQHKAGRRVDLDWVRIAAFGLLILYHVGMLYVPWDFHVKSANAVPGLAPLMVALNPWRLSLLFLVSGAATRFMAEARGPGALLLGRSTRLLPPLVFGMLVVVPPQSFFQVIEKNGYAGSFPEFYVEHYLAFTDQFCRAGRCLALPTWNHLWFVAYLWVYTAALILLIAAAPTLLRWAEGPIVRALSGPWLLVLPVLALAGYRLLLFPHFPQTNALAGDWYGHALYGSFFLLGYLAAPCEAVCAATVRWRWAALALAVVAYAGFNLWRVLPAPAAPAPQLALLVCGRVAYAAYQWFCTVAVLGFGARWLTRDGPARRYLTEAIFPYYIIHQTTIVAVAFALRGAGLPASVEAGLVILATALSCALGFEIVRRVAWLRPLFGLKLARALTLPRLRMPRRRAA